MSNNDLKLSLSDAMITEGVSSPPEPVPSVKCLLAEIHIQSLADDSKTILETTASPTTNLIHQNRGTCPTVGCRVEMTDGNRLATNNHESCRAPFQPLHWQGFIRTLICHRMCHHVAISTTTIVDINPHLLIILCSLIIRLFF